MSQLRLFKALIADDEPLSRGYLRALAELDDRFEVVALCDSGFAAIEYAEDSPLDVAFLDIRMPGLDGFQAMAKMQGANPLVVFVTAYSDYAVKAYDCGAFDYVTKPIDPARFAETLNRLSDRLLERDAAQAGAATYAARPAPNFQASEEKRVLAGVRQDVVFSESEIEVIESQGNYVSVRINGESVLVRQSLDSFCRLLDSPSFMQVHRSFVVNLVYVRAIRYEKSGTAELDLAGGFVVPVSRRHRSAVAELLRSTLSREP
ncbi:Transcriptional regulatory protein YehT [Botrimarina colliarenosi]|uniref:Transcriptional regulatory protein YehT n=1 Tax=Botrimarina colliarenosi TaxID=2528001 RepID=A0A5C5ZW29_9BACT|nr:LytTR family DNA-binding domain-containing protein [Botrimarina colliarenosi]TWT91802.1 Transcriptional regulatory protein YehT [Botrimarina colliarenosi]